MPRVTPRVGVIYGHTLKPVPQGDNVSSVLFGVWHILALQIDFLLSVPAEVYGLCSPPERVILAKVAVSISHETV